jgi:hypothetical protein
LSNKNWLITEITDGTARLITNPRRLRRKKKTENPPISFENIKSVSVHSTEPLARCTAQPLARHRTALNAPNLMTFGDSGGGASGATFPG